MSPGTIPDAVSASLSVSNSSASAESYFSQGGFDPIAIEAVGGDTIFINVLHENGTHELTFALVPSRKPPSIVRTSPVAQRTDVALSAIVTVVFDEPMDSASVANGSHLQLDGTDVPSTLKLSTAGDGTIAVDILPSASLNAETVYSIVVDGSVRNLAGDSLGSTLTIGFTTQPTAAPASDSLIVTSFRMMEVKYPSDPGWNYIPLITVSSEVGTIRIDELDLLDSPPSAPNGAPPMCANDLVVQAGQPLDLNYVDESGAYVAGYENANGSRWPAGTVTLRLSYLIADGTRHSELLSGRIESGLVSAIDPTRVGGWVGTCGTP